MKNIKIDRLILSNLELITNGDYSLENQREANDFFISRHYRRTFPWGRNPFRFKSQMGGKFIKKWHVSDELYIDYLETCRYVVQKQVGRTDNLISDWMTAAIHDKK